jgi:hypothetical protein
MSLRSNKRFLTVAGVAVVALAAAATAVAVSGNGPDARKQALLAHQFAIPPGAAPPAAKNPNAPLPNDPPTPDAALLGKVLTADVQAPVQNQVFKPTSEWITVVNGVQTVIYAGVAPLSHGAGAIYVWVTDLNNGQDRTAQLYPSKYNGPLTLTDVTGTTASFKTATGATGAFDLDTRSFG